MNTVENCLTIVPIAVGGVALYVTVTRKRMVINMDTYERTGLTWFDIMEMKDEMDVDGSNMEE